MQDSREDRCTKMKQFIITKRIAKHGKQAILVIPKLLETELKPGTVVKVTMDVVNEVGNDETRGGGCS